MSIKELHQIVAKEFSEVDQLIENSLQSRVPLVENIGSYITKAGGKRLRPLLALICAKALNSDAKEHLAYAALVEFIHTATLLHDDVVDISDMRRGRPTANAKWGNAPSVLVGDFLYTRAFQLLAGIGDIKLVQLVSDTANELAEGEVEQLSNTGRSNTTEASYFSVIRQKTAVLMAACCAGSAMIARAEQETVKQLYDYGLNLGMAFQLADDVLDYIGDAETMGKSVGDDLAEGKPTLPLIYAIEKLPADEAKIIADAIANKDASNYPQILQLVNQSGAIKYTQDRANSYVNASISGLTNIPDSNFKSALVDIAEFSAIRSH